METHAPTRRHIHVDTHLNHSQVWDILIAFTEKRIDATVMSVFDVEDD